MDNILKEYQGAPALKFAVAKGNNSALIKKLLSEHFQITE